MYSVYFNKQNLPPIFQQKNPTQNVILKKMSKKINLWQILDMYITSDCKSKSKYDLQYTKN